MLVAQQLHGIPDLLGEIADFFNSFRSNVNTPYQSTYGGG